MADETTTTTEGASSTTTTQTGADKTGQQQTQQTDAKTYTQEQLDKMFGQRAAQAKTAAVTELLESLGVKSADELTKTLEAHRKSEEAKLSDIEKANNATAKEKAERERVEAELQKERDSRKQEKLDTAIRAAAKGAHNPELVVLALRNFHAEALAKVMKDDGAIDTKALEILVNELRKSDKHLFGSTSPGSPSNHGGIPNEPDAKEKELARGGMRRQMKTAF